jgi:hypothetical protein
MRICSWAGIIANCKKEKKKLENCKAVRKKGGKINNECSSKVGFFSGAEGYLSF